MECYPTTVDNGDSLEKPTICSQNKRNRNANDERSKDKKTAKMAAVLVELE
jgi:hypothetical protein